MQPDSGSRGAPTGPVPARPATYTYSAITTNDGVSIRYLDVGAGLPLIMIHGLGQTAEQFDKQICHFRRTHRVIAVDLRGHGESDKPAHGYRIARLAEDLCALIADLRLDRFVLLGHSMGCSVIWSYLDQHGQRGVEKLILVDEPAVLAADPAWTSDEVKTSGALFQATEVYEQASRIAANRQYPQTPDMSREDREFFARRNSLLPPRHEAALLINHAFQDWRDVFPRITVPTLVIAGAAMAPALKWIATQIPNAKLELFDADQGGSHFMFWDNPHRFNAVVQEFLCAGG